jgi:hypothetical protein
MKKCKICGLEKEFNEFYSHSKAKDGLLNKCKTCAKNLSNQRYKKLSENPEFLEKERERSREKNQRLVRKKRTTDQNRKARLQYREQFPEKARAYNHSRKLQKIEDFENHHWSYNKEHYLDCIQLSKLDHKKAHRFLIYDQERYMYRRCDTMELLDTKESHEKFIRQKINELECINK